MQFSGVFIVENLLRNFILFYRNAFWYSDAKRTAPIARFAIEFELIGNHVEALPLVTCQNCIILLFFSG